jgi:hypothetical protein
MSGDRPRDVSNLTSAELERARRDLNISLALAFPGSLVRVPILEELSAIDRELADRTTIRPEDRQGSIDETHLGNDSTDGSDHDAPLPGQNLRRA